MRTPIHPPASPTPDPPGSDPLQAARAEIESMLHSISHDFRAPLRAIESFSAILREDHSAQLDAEGKRVLNIICSSSQKLKSMLDDILAFSRVSRRPPVPQPLDMGALVQNVWEGLRQESIGRKIEFIPGPIPPAVGDANHAWLIWCHLLDNAVKFTTAQSPARIEVGGGTEEALNHYWVRDNGPGIDLSRIDTPFALFQRFHGRDDIRGNGVGLALVRRLLDINGGRIRMESSPGRGTTVHFHLPGGKATGF